MFDRSVRAARLALVLLLTAPLVTRALTALDEDSTQPPILFTAWYHLAQTFQILNQPLAAVQAFSIDDSATTEIDDALGNGESTPESEALLGELISCIPVGS